MFISSKDLEFKVLVLLAFLSFFLPGRYIYFSSTVSILIFTRLLLFKNIKFEINFIFFLLISGIFLSLGITAYNLYFDNIIRFSNKALITHLGFIIQFLIIILFVNNNYKIKFIQSISKVIQDNILFLSLLSFLGNISQITLSYQGSTSWPSLITFYYSLIDKSLNKSLRYLILIISIFTIYTSSKRATILSLAITFLIYLISNYNQIINEIINIFIKLKLKIKILFAIIISTLLTIVISNYFFSYLVKLQTTFDILLNNTFPLDEYKIILLTGGRNLELFDFLNSLDLSFIDLLIKLSTTGIGIGWYNKISNSASFHNSLILISLIGGLPWLLIYLKIVFVAFRNIFQRNSIYIYKENVYLIKVSAFISIAMSIDSFFSGNFAASFLALYFFSTPLCFNRKIVNFKK